MKRYVFKHKGIIICMVDVSPINPNYALLRRLDGSFERYYSEIDAINQAKLILSQYKTEGNK